VKTTSVHKLALGWPIVVLIVLALSCWGCGPKQNQPSSPAASERSPVSESIPTTNPEPATTEPPTESAQTPGDETIPAADTPPDNPEAPAEHTDKVLNVFENTFEKEVLQARHPVIVEFGATYCMPCYIVRPVLDELAKEYAGRLKFVSADIEVNPRLASKFGVTYIPMLVVIENGEETQRFGFANEQQLHQVVAEIAASAD